MIHTVCRHSNTYVYFVMSTADDKADRSAVQQSLGGISIIQHERTASIGTKGEGIDDAVTSRVGYLRGLFTTVSWVLSTKAHGI